MTKLEVDAFPLGEQLGVLEHFFWKRGNISFKELRGGETAGCSAHGASSAGATGRVAELSKAEAIKLCMRVWEEEKNVWQSAAPEVVSAFLEEDGDDRGRIIRPEGRRWRQWYKEKQGAAADGAAGEENNDDELGTLADADPTMVPEDEGHATQTVAASVDFSEEDSFDLVEHHGTSLVHFSPKQTLLFEGPFSQSKRTV